MDSDKISERSQLINANTNTITYTYTNPTNTPQKHEGEEEPHKYASFLRPLFQRNNSLPSTGTEESPDSRYTPLSSPVNNGSNGNDDGYEYNDIDIEQSQSNKIKKNSKRSYVFTILSIIVGFVMCVGGCLFGVMAYKSRGNGYYEYGFENETVYQKYITSRYQQLHKNSAEENGDDGDDEDDDDDLYYVQNDCKETSLNTNTITYKRSRSNPSFNIAGKYTGPYKLTSHHDPTDNTFFDGFDFFDGQDSKGSNAYVVYVNQSYALERGMIGFIDRGDSYVKPESANNVKNVNSGGRRGVYESSDHVREGRRAFMRSSTGHIHSNCDDDDDNNTTNNSNSNSNSNNPLNSIRLEGKIQHTHGIFIISLPHIPASPGTWPAFWLTNESTWPSSGEIDIVESINNQRYAKTALHATDGCTMDGVLVEGVMSGVWDTAYGIPDAHTGMPGKEFRYALDCYVYAEKQWVNQGCVVEAKSSNEEGGYVDTIGKEVNEGGGGVYVLEWDPAGGKIRAWVFRNDAGDGNLKIPDNVLDIITKTDDDGDDGDNEVTPDPSQWPLPYAHYPIGPHTGCSTNHFCGMHLVFNLAFCGSVAGTRFKLDHPALFEKYGSCEGFVDAVSGADCSGGSGDGEKEEVGLDEAYWEVGGVWVFQKEWEEDKE